jgi:lipoate-protein ligase A
MAIDEVLALGCDEGWSPPSLRLYRWAVPTVSLGYNQPVQGEVNLAICREGGVPLVRRPTGGRALLHHHEVTYSLALPLRSGNRGVLEDYRWISHCLLFALRGLGVAATLSRGDRAADGARGLCLLAPARYEVTVNGRKLVGSAQRRWGRALLQHGSVLIDIEHPTWMAIFPQGEALEARATALRVVLGRSPSWAELVDAIRRGFEEGAGITLKPAELTTREWMLARKLVLSRYGTAEWTLRR